MDGLAAIVADEFDLDPFVEPLTFFRSRRGFVGGGIHANNDALLLAVKALRLILKGRGVRICSRDCD